MTCNNFLYQKLQGGPTGPLAPPTRRARLRSRWRSRYGGASAGRLARRTGDFRAAVDRQQLPGAQPQGVHAPAAELSKAGQNPSRPSVTAGQPQPLSCLVEVHAKTTLTEPARPRRWQRSEAWTRVTKTVDAQASGLCWCTSDAIGPNPSELFHVPATALKSPQPCANSPDFAAVSHHRRMVPI